MFQALDSFSLQPSDRQAQQQSTREFIENEQQTANFDLFRSSEIFVFDDSAGQQHKD